MFKNQWGQPGVHELMKELRSILNEYDGDRMLVGEDDNIDFMGDGEDELHLVFNFPLANVNRITPEHIRKNQTERIARLNQLAKGGWACNTLGNHDRSRIYTFYGDKLHDAELARLNAALTLTLRGTPFLYNGEEIGMTDYLLPHISQVKDTMGSWYYHTIVTEMGVDPEEAMFRTAEMTRDKNRTPMHWSNKANAGFSPEGVETWLPINPNYKEGINVFEQEQNPSSILNYYKHLLKVRKASPALVEGDYLPLHEDATDYFAFIRKSDKQTVLVVLNYSDKRLRLNFSSDQDVNGKNLHTLFTSAVRSPADHKADNLTIAPFEVFIAEVTA